MPLNEEVLIYEFRKSWIFYRNGKKFRAHYSKKLLPNNKWVKFLSCYEVYPNHEVLRHYWDTVYAF